MGRSRATIAATTLILGLALGTPAASAKTIRLNWSERLAGQSGFLAMTFNVRSVTIGKKAWSVRARVTNRSKSTVQIVPPIDTSPQQFGFGLAFFHPSCPRGATCGLDVLQATYSKPHLPRALRPGGSWSGTFGGPKLPPRGAGISVTFGYFYVSRNVHFGYSTNREFRR